MERHANATFDYIIIGTGPAGSVIANKLTGDKKTSVLVLEGAYIKENLSPTQPHASNGP